MSASKKAKAKARGKAPSTSGPRRSYRLAAGNFADTSDLLGSYNAFEALEDLAEESEDSGSGDSRKLLLIHHRDLEALSVRLNDMDDYFMAWLGQLASRLQHLESFVPSYLTSLATLEERVDAIDPAADSTALSTPARCAALEARCGLFASFESRLAQLETPIKTTLESRINALFFYR